MIVSFILLLYVWYIYSLVRPVKSTTISVSSTNPAVTPGDVDMVSPVVYDPVAINNQIDEMLGAVPLIITNYTRVPDWYICKWVQDLAISPAEQIIIDILNEYDIWWEREVSFVSMPYTNKGGVYRYDFLLPDHGIIIEYDSKLWHSNPDRISTDHIKSEFCRANNIKLIRYTTHHYHHLDKEIDNLMTELGIPMKSIAV